MKSILFFIVTILALPLSLYAADFFSSAYLESYRIDTYDSYMLSPNLLVRYGRFEAYGFIDRYFHRSSFYHGELLLAFQPLTMKPFDRLSLIAERRWDKYAVNENSYGIRLKIW